MLAIMHTESGFNPFAVSSRQAVGLMQIVPETAGNEVHSFLMGARGTPSLETLLNPEHNIKYGAAYLYLLGQHHLGGIHNPVSRQMCVIAAYNCGPGAVLRLFSPDQEQAIARINAMSSEEIYTRLITELPYQETRRYVELVLNRMQRYSF